MKGTKKSLFFMFALILVVMGTYLVAGTYAKYTSEIEGSSETSIAAWAWEINDLTLTKTTNTYELNLFETISDSDATLDETDVTDGLIAPGTSGKFDITIKNNSEVNATYAYAFTIENPLNAKIQWSLDNQTWTKNIADLDVTATNLAIGSEAVKKTIYWKWEFEENDEQNNSDTAVGFDAANSAEEDRKVVVNATLTLNQVD